MAELHLIAGPNGSGKSTLYAQRIKPLRPALQFVNADLIERAHKDRGEDIDSYAAAKLAAEFRAGCIRRGESFVTETVFSHPSKLDLMRDARAAGFRIFLHHVNVADPLISVRRVDQRVAAGGHPVPEQKIIERYSRCNGLIAEASAMAFSTYVFDNSAPNNPCALVLMLHDQIWQLGEPYDKELGGTKPIPQWVLEHYGHVLEPV